MGRPDIGLFLDQAENLIEKWVTNRLMANWHPPRISENPWFYW